MQPQGYLINQFITKCTNQRIDEWGGEYENRIRFPLQIVKRVKDKIKLIYNDLEISIALWDERLSTVGSFNLSSQLDVNVSKRVKNIDQNSATFILQGVLDYLAK